KLSNEIILDLFKQAREAGSITLVLFYNPERLRDVEIGWEVARKQLETLTEGNALLKSKAMELEGRIEILKDNSGPARLSRTVALST
ncbi:hypothetical protein PMAYCL1PPCAC_20474, partial [Pristionchus mayeri]